MFKKTALFIYLFQSKGLKNLLEEHFLEQLGMIETIASMDMDKETQFQFNYLFEKDLPSFLNNYSQATKLSLTDMEDNLSQQANAIKETILSIYLNTTQSVKHDMKLQLKVLTHRNNKIKANMGTSTQLEQKEEFLEDVQTEITLENYKSFKEQGLAILKENENEATWQNNFTTVSDKLIKVDKNSERNSSSEEYAHRNEPTLENNGFSNLHIIIAALTIIATSILLIF